MRLSVHGVVLQFALFPLILAACTAPNETYLLGSVDSPPHERDDSYAQSLQTLGQLDESGRPACGSACIVDFNPCLIGIVDCSSHSARECVLSWVRNEGDSCREGGFCNRLHHCVQHESCNGVDDDENGLIDDLDADADGRVDCGDVVSTDPLPAVSF